jgi:triosephosphate isomerase
MVKTPVVALNFKVYEEVVGEKGLALARTCEEVAKETGASIAIAPQQTDLALIVREVDIPVFAQHVDNVKVGSNTGHVTPEAVKGCGALGTLINHSECRVKIADIEASVTRCNKLGLETILCTNNLAVSKACSLVNPTFVAVEPPELIGGDISVTSADPKIVSDTAQALKELNPKVKVLTGAGVKTGKDVAMAIELGTDGVLLASGVTKAKDPKAALLDLVSGL